MRASYSAGNHKTSQLARSIAEHTSWKLSTVARTVAVDFVLQFERARFRKTRLDSDFR